MVLLTDEDQLKKRKKLTRRVIRDDTPTGEFDPMHAFQPLAASQVVLSMSSHSFDATFLPQPDAFCNVITFLVLPPKIIG